MMACGWTAQPPLASFHIQDNGVAQGFYLDAALMDPIC